MTRPRAPPRAFRPQRSPAPGRSNRRPSGARPAGRARHLSRSVRRSSCPGLAASARRTRPYCRSLGPMRRSGSRLHERGGAERRSKRNNERREKTLHVVYLPDRPHPVLPRCHCLATFPHRSGGGARQGTGEVRFGFTTGRSVGPAAGGVGRVPSVRFRPLASASTPAAFDLRWRNPGPGRIYVTNGRPVGGLITSPRPRECAFR